MLSCKAYFLPVGGEISAALKWHAAVLGQDSKLMSNFGLIEQDALIVGHYGKPGLTDFIQYTE